MSKKNKVTMKIAGKDCNILSNESTEYIHKVGHLVDKRMSDIMQNANGISPLMASILTSINLTDDLFKAREAENYFKDELLKMKKLVDELKNRQG